LSPDPSLGWIDGRNLRMDVRWVPGNVEQMRTFAKELVDLQPDVILANSTSVTAALHRETHTIPIVFAIVSDPVGEGFVESVPRPGGNITGFVHNEPSPGGKWVELLKEIAPGIKRVSAIFNPDTAPYAKTYYLPSIEAGAQSFGVTSSNAPVHNDAEIEMAIKSLTREPRCGLLVMPDNFMNIHRAQITSLASQNCVPAVYQIPISVRDGGLLSYGTDFRDIFRRAASYVDRILRGAKPADLPSNCRSSL
jgi:putative tryptophan/tyrosine transport system substrate-binding protein